MEMNHFSHEHPLSLSEEKPNKNFPCSICCDPIFGLSYCCVVCQYTLHKWCADLPRELSPHKLHPSHPLILCNLPNEQLSNPSICSSCELEIFGFAYKCTPTSDVDNYPFNFHVHCAFFPDPIIFDVPGDTTELTLYVYGCTLPETPCVICGYEIDGPVFTGLNERFYHFQCVTFPRVVKHEVHRHELSLRPPLIEKDWYTEFYCDACEKERDPKTFVYYCEPCELVAHIGCGISGSDRPFQDVIGNYSVYKSLESIEESPNFQMGSPLYEFGLAEEPEEVDPQTQVEHFRHQHPLILVHFAKTIQEFCKGCESRIFGLTYYCKNTEQCYFYIHKRCAELPKQVNHSMHPHHGSLKLLPPNGLFWCHFCGQNFDSCPFGCEKCDFRLDARCALMRTNLNHPSHEHVLSPVIIEPWGDSLDETPSDSKLKLPIKVRRHPFCQACGYLCDGVSLMCEKCDFYLHVFCSLLPLSGKHETHRHELDLTYSYEEEDPNALEFICDTCEKPRIPNRWVYCCPEPKCYIVSHVGCVAPDVFASFKLQK